MPVSEAGDVIALRPRERGDDAPVRRARVVKRYCGHRRIEVDERARLVECRDCGASVDPIAALAMLAG
jgi:hypothetical protein